MQRKNLINFKKQKITNNYKFVKELGRGATGVCFQAVQKDSSIKRCVKKVPKVESKDKKNLPLQVELLDQLSHPGIIRMDEVYQDEKSYYLVVDLCEGGQLFDYLNDQGVLSEHEAKEIFFQMISAVKYCHSKNIAHRDLKPENFLILEKTPSGQTPNLRLIDFDLSFQWTNKMDQQIIAREGKRIIGTPYYIAPEVLKGKYDHRCDIWSLGVILYILVSGVPPFNGNSPNQILKQIQKQDPKIDIPQMSDISLLLKDLLKKMLSPAEKRITIEQIFKHPWMKVTPKKTKMQIDYTSMIKYSKFSRLKQIAATYLGMQMTSNQLIKYQDIFRNLDANRDGYLSVEELKAGLEQNPCCKQLQNLIHFIQTDSDGMMNYQDFIASFVNEKIINSKKNLQYVFKIIDNDGNGVVDRQELNSVLKRHDMRRKALKEISGNDSNRIFLVADKNNDGKIDFEEFVATVCNQIEI